MQPSSRSRPADAAHYREGVGLGRGWSSRAGSVASRRDDEPHAEPRSPEQDEHDVGTAPSARSGHRQCVAGHEAAQCALCSGVRVLTVTRHGRAAAVRGSPQDTVTRHPATATLVGAPGPPDGRCASRPANGAERPERSRGRARCQRCGWREARSVPVMQGTIVDAWTDVASGEPRPRRVRFAAAAWRSPPAEREVGRDRLGAHAAEQVYAAAEERLQTPPSTPLGPPDGTRIGRPGVATLAAMDDAEPPDAAAGSWSSGARETLPRPEASRSLGRAAGPVAAGGDC